MQVLTTTPTLLPHRWRGATHLLSLALPHTNGPPLTLSANPVPSRRPISADISADISVDLGTRGLSGRAGSAGSGTGRSRGRKKDRASERSSKRSAEEEEEEALVEALADGIPSVSSMEAADGIPRKAVLVQQCGSALDVERELQRLWPVPERPTAFVAEGAATAEGAAAVENGPAAVPARTSIASAWAVMLPDPSAPPCDLLQALGALSALGFTRVAIPEGLPCGPNKAGGPGEPPPAFGPPPASADAPTAAEAAAKERRRQRSPSDARHGASGSSSSPMDDSSWWPPSWPRARHSRGLCVPTPAYDEGLTNPVPSLFTLPHAAVAALRERLDQVYDTHKDRVRSAADGSLSVSPPSSSPAPIGPREPPPARTQTSEDSQTLAATAPVQNLHVHCWWPCEEKAGLCHFCGPEGACCRHGFDMMLHECAQGHSGCIDHHCCVPATQGSSEELAQGADETPQKLHGADETPQKLHGADETPQKLVPPELLLHAALSAYELPNASSALAQLPPSLRSITLDVLQPAPSEPGGLRMTSMTSMPVAAGSIGTNLRGPPQLSWQINVRAHGDGILKLEAAETTPDGRWQPFHTILSQRQEVSSLGAHHGASCHRPDKRANSACASNVDCGVSIETCLERRCSAYGFCFTPIPNADESR